MCWLLIPATRPPAILRMSSVGPIPGRPNTGAVPEPTFTITTRPGRAGGETPPEPVQRAYLLKNLTGLSRWVGTLVHESIKFALTRLRAGRPVSDADLFRQMQNRARADFDDSQSGRYRQRPNQLTGFQEHYYRVDLPQEAWQAAVSQAGRCLRTFVDSALYATLRRRSPASFLEVEELLSFTPSGTKIWVKMDLARQEDGAIYLYDWKTGRVDAEEIRQQLGIYGLFVRHAWPKIAGPGGANPGDCLCPGGRSPV